MSNARDYEWGGRKWRQEEHGSTIALGDGSAPGTRTDLLRGSFALVRYEDGNGGGETRLVLLGFEPENRKLVYEAIDEVVGCLVLVQDSPGMAREGE